MRGEVTGGGEPVGVADLPAGPDRPPVDRPRRGAGRVGRAAGAILGVPTPLIFVGSVLLAVVLLWRQGTIADLGRVARGVDRWVAGLAFGLYLVGLGLLSARWHLLVRMIHGRSDPARASEAFLTSVVVNYAAPIGLAVPTRAALTMRGLGLSPAETGSLALWEIAADVLVLGAGMMVWLVTTRAGSDALEAAGGVDARLVVALGLAGVAGALVVAVVVARRPWGRRWAERAAVVGTEALRHPGRRPREAARALGATVAYWLLQGIVLRLLLGAVDVGAGAEIGLVLGLVSLPVLVGMLSPVPGGAGVREALMVAVAQGQGESGAAVLLAAVAYRAALFLAVPVLYVGVRLWLLRRRRRERRLSY